MKFTVVPSAKQRPQKCVALPQLGTSHEKGYFDTGNSVTGNDLRNYVSVRWVEMAAEHLGWHPPGSLNDLVAGLGEKDREIADKDTQIKQMDKELEAVEALRSHRWRPQSKPGPRPGTKRKKVGVAMEDEL